MKQLKLLSLSSQGLKMELLNLKCRFYKLSNPLKTFDFVNIVGARVVVFLGSGERAPTNLP